MRSNAYFLFLMTDREVHKSQGAVDILVSGLPSAAVRIMPRSGRPQCGADEGSVKGEEGGAKGTRKDHSRQRTGGEEENHGLRHHVFGAALAGGSLGR